MGLLSIGKNALIGLATNLAVFGLGILLSVVLTRSLGEAGRGVYVILITTNSLVSSLVGLGVGTACRPLLAQGRYSLGAMNVAAALLAAGMGLVGLGGTSLAFLFLQDSVFQGVLYSHLLVALVLVPCTVYQFYWSMMMMGLGHLLVMNKFALVLNLTSTVLMLGAVGGLHAGIPGFLAAWGLTTVTGAATAFCIAARMDRPAWPSRALFHDLLSIGLRVHGADIAHYLFLRFDMFAVNALVGTAGVGFYSLATSLAEKLWLPSQTINDSAVGKIAQLPRAESALLTAKVTRTTLLIMVVLGVPFALVSPWLIPWLYGASFAVAVLPLVILLAGTLGFAGMMVLNNYVLSQMARPGLLSLVAWAQLAISIPLYLLLIGQYGIVGAALASALTYGLALLGTLIVFVRDSGLSAARVLLPQAGDFRDYARVIGKAWARLPRPHRPAQRPS